MTAHIMLVQPIILIFVSRSINWEKVQDIHPLDYQSNSFTTKNMIAYQTRMLESSRFKVGPGASVKL